ncbi:MAG: tRNA epoxyqueuosine(34) reductase QueG [Phycisphaerales bacterium]
MSFEEKIKQKALSLGFDIVGITSADDIDKQQLSEFKQWLAQGCNGGMEFLARAPEKRFSPSNILPEAKSIICAAINYKCNVPENPDFKIASYALYPDYHNFIKNKLSELAEYLKTFDPNLKFKICVDSSAIAEKALAMRAGIGFIGKNRLITNQKFGSFLLLGEIITNFTLQPDEPIKKQQCGNCMKCVQACPSGALNENGFDAAKCISYLTIEHKGEIDTALKNKIPPHLFGCEECLLACPYNTESPICEKAQYGFEAKNVNFTISEILKFSKQQFDEFTKDSVMNRTGLDRIKRNALLCRDFK